MSVNNNIKEQTFCLWKSKYGGMAVSEAKCLKQLEGENCRLKEMIAGLSLDNKILKDVFLKMSEACRKTQNSNQDIGML